MLALIVGELIEATPPAGDISGTYPASSPLTAPGRAVAAASVAAGVGVTSLRSGAGWVSGGAAAGRVAVGLGLGRSVDVG